MELQAYYDGATFRPLEKVSLPKNQTVVITVSDNQAEKERLSGSLHKYARPKMSEEERIKKIKELRGALHQYAKPSAEKAMEEEEGAWERAAVEKYGSI